jgi:hemoglobin/transferrin/lactoferrin receptor protein
MKRDLFRVVVLGALALGRAVPAMAGTVGDEAVTAEGRPIILHDVVITATRTEKQTFDIPETVEVLDAEDLQNRQLARTVPEALREVPGVLMQKTSHGQGSPYIRGFTGFRTLFLIDGIRLNNSVFRDGPNQYWGTVDPLTIQRLEVVKGTGSVLYGSDAIGGTVNALTRTFDPTSVDRAWQPRLYYRYASAEDAHVARAEVGAAPGDDRVRIFAGASWKDFGDVRGGRELGLQPHTGYDEVDGDVKIEYRFDHDARLVFAHEQVEQDDAWRTHKTIFAKSWEGTDVGNEKRRSLDQTRRLTYLQYRGHDLAPAIAGLTASLSWHTQEEEQFRIKKDDKSDRQGFDVDTLGAWLQVETASPVGLWTYGAEWYRDDVSSFLKEYAADGSLSSVAIQGPVADDATYDLGGLFVQDDVALFDGVDLIAGGRYTYARAAAGRFQDPVTGDASSRSQSWDTVVGSARLLWAVDQADHWHLFAGLSQGFRAPNLSDLTSSVEARSDEQEIPATDLDPEHFLSGEIGVKARFDRAAFAVSYFYTAIDGMIIRAPTGRVTAGGLREVTKRNSGDGFVHGVEVGGSLGVPGDLTAFGTFAWLEGEVDTFVTSDAPAVRAPISRLMPPTATAGLRWEPAERSGWLEGLVTVAGEADRLSPSDQLDTQRIPPGGTPGYVVATVRGGLEIRDGLTLSAAVENITDEDYRIHGSGQNEPGTNFVIGLDWRI